MRLDCRDGSRTLLRLAVILLVATSMAFLGGCRSTAVVVTPPPPPVQHMNVLTVTPNTDATAATQYNFYRSTNGGAFVRISTAPQFGLVYDDSEITVGMVYEYQARAVVNGVESGPSVTVTLTAK